MAFPEFTRGLHDIGNGHFAFLQPDGGWGWNNTGLITDGDQTLLVDTMYDEHLTGEMLDEVQRRLGITAKDIDRVVNTHANGDHTYGNRCVCHAEIITSRASADEFDALTPATMLGIMAHATGEGLSAKFLRHAFGSFDFAGVQLTGPTMTFSGQLDLKVGDKPVTILEVGPAHTQGDILVHSPTDKVVYTGDILFIDSTPIIWAGPVSNWVKAIDWILENPDIDIVVPGHGPVCDKARARELRGYLVYIDTEARKRYDAGMSPVDACFDIALSDYASWGDAERIVLNIDSLYKGYSGQPTGTGLMDLVDLMARIRHDLGRL